MFELNTFIIIPIIKKSTPTVARRTIV